MKGVIRNRAAHEEGVALLAALLAVTLMTLVVVDFTYTATVAYRAAANQANELRAAYLARSGINLGIGLLDQDARSDSNQRQPYDGLTDLWATPFPPLPVDGGYAALSIVDENRKLAINQLVNPSTGQVNTVVRDQFNRLFNTLGTSDDLLPSIIDWLDADNVPSAGGAESSYYLALAPPYEPRNGPMPTIGDLRMVKGIDEPTFLLLSGLVTTAPVNKVNINTAPPEVIASLLPELQANPAIVKAIVAQRAEEPFTSAVDLKQIPAVAPLYTKLSPFIDVKSDHFLITGVGNYAGARKLVFATVRRNPQGAALLASWHED
jgi:general secretion pathway protein K